MQTQAPFNKAQAEASQEARHANIRKLLDTMASFEPGPYANPMATAPTAAAIFFIMACGRTSKLDALKCMTIAQTVIDTMPGLAQTYAAAVVNLRESGIPYDEMTDYQILDEFAKITTANLSKYMEENGIT